MSAFSGSRRALQSLTTSPAAENNSSTGMDVAWTTWFLAAIMLENGYNG